MEVDSGWIIAFIPRIQGKEVPWHGGLRLFVGISHEDVCQPLALCLPRHRYVSVLFFLSQAPILPSATFLVLYLRQK